MRLPCSQPLPRTLHEAALARDESIRPVCGPTILGVALSMAERWLATQWPVLSRASRASQEGHSLLPEDSQRTPSSLSRPEPTRSSTADGLRAAMSPGRSERAFRSGNERLYEAYNDLHALAQDFEKPFDAPAILVVGHQTDGKSGPRRGRWVGEFLALRLVSMESVDRNVETNHWAVVPPRECNLELS